MCICVNDATVNDATNVDHTDELYEMCFDLETKIKRIVGEAF